MGGCLLKIGLEGTEDSSSPPLWLPQQPTPHNKTNLDDIALTCH